MENHLIDLINISKSFDGTEALHKINLYVKPQEFVTLLGASGCGKTTMLRIIGGFESPDEGKVLFQGQEITELPPHKRHVNTIFQRYALFPHLNVFDNVAFALYLKKLDKTAIKKKVTAMLELVGLVGFDKRDVESLSGGQQQRVAIARALVNEPKMLLLDEPLAALDLKLRKEMQVELKKMQQQLGITFLYVTHDQEEALTMSDKIVVMKDGNIHQIGTPVDIYNEPKDAFVADFIGESNILDAMMIDDYKVFFAGREFECVDAGFGRNTPVDAVVRPEDIKVVPEVNGMISGIVKSIIFMGVHYEIIVSAQDFTWRIHSTKSVKPGTVIGMDIYPDEIHIMRKAEA